MKAYVFPGQGSQFVGMGKDLYESSKLAADLFEAANECLGFRISDIMFEGTVEALKQTNVTQPAVFIHSIVKAKLNGDSLPATAVAGHSLGEFSALVANGTLDFMDGLKLVQKRAEAMQRACELNEGTMAAILALEDAIIEKICANIDAVVVPANYNCPGQLVISGSIEGIEIAVEQLKAAGAKRAIVLNVGGAFHSPLMEPARVNLEAAIDAMNFRMPSCPIYQNVNGEPQTDPNAIKENLVKQLTAPVKWTQTMQNMIENGVEEFIEVGGSGKVLQGFVKKIDRRFPTAAL